MADEEQGQTCGLCGEKTQGDGTVIDGVIYCDDCLYTEGVEF